MKLEHSENKKFFHVEGERIKDEFAAKKIADGKNSFRENLRKLFLVTANFLTFFIEDDGT